MTSFLPLEQQILVRAERLLTDATKASRPSSRHTERLAILEAASARLGGFDVRDYHEAFQIETRFAVDAIDTVAARLLDELSRLPMHSSLALCALAREPLTSHVTRTSGAHYTDFRLAQLIGRKAAEWHAEGRAIVDPAAGAGILLVATTLAICGQDRKRTTEWLSSSVVAADMSGTALRGARLALASLTDRVDAIVHMTRHWFIGDSLLRPTSAWNEAGHDSYLVVGNPPWEKLKVHLHEEEVAMGSDRHYGAARKPYSIDLTQRRETMRSYAQEVSRRFPLISGGEADMFAAFTQLMMQLAGPNGAMVALVPAGLIRSKSTQGLREALTRRFANVGFSIIDNKTRFFAIDTRFKFLAVTASGTKARANASTRITISHATGDAVGCTEGAGTAVPLSTLRALRPDLSIPEVRDGAEWRLFLKMNRSGLRWNSPDSPWYPDFAREVDMTRERRHFVEADGRGLLPLVEGRMVHQHRFGAKEYVEGSGRRAIWEPTMPGHSRVRPQFWIHPDRVPTSARVRATVDRAGFCDIAGQTNERSMLAAMIPAGVACGNKVPTIVFPNSPGENALLLWCAMVNSFAFDWMLRRVLTTTVNYFLLQSVPLPPIAPDSLPGRRMIDAAKEIMLLDNTPRSVDPRPRMAELRRQIDVACFRAYGITGAEARTVMADFPSIDRAQRPLAGERRSTVTRDYLLAAMPGSYRHEAETRSKAALALGAIAYLPSQSRMEDDTSFQASARPA